MARSRFWARVLASSLPELCAAALVLAASPASAQVSVNLNALHALHGTPNAAAKPKPHFTIPSDTTPRGTLLPLPPLPPTPPRATPETHHVMLPGTAIGPIPSPPPKTPPPPPVIAPIVLVGPTHPEPMPPRPLVVASAPGRVMPIPDGVRITFGSDDAALNPKTLEALKAFASVAARTHARSVSVDAYAPDDPSDPSTPRRLSLARALAARAIFREAGIPSEKIFVRARLAGDKLAAPANRVDVTVAASAKASP